MTTHLSSTLFYGILVATTTLIAAAESYAQLKAPLLGLDLIIKRRKLGELASSNSSKVVKVPEEVWEMTRKELIKIELHDANMRLKDLVRCDDCKEVLKIQGEVADKDWTFWANPWNTCNDQSCHDGINDVFLERFHFHNKTDGNIEQLLQQFGLRLEKAYFQIENYEMPMDGDSTSVSALSMIPIKLAGTSTSINHCVGNQFPQQMALKNISPETFSIPVSTTERLRAKIKVLLESFDVDALDKENTDDDDDEADVVEEEPRWIMITGVEMVF